MSQHNPSYTQVSWSSDPNYGVLHGIFENEALGGGLSYREATRWATEATALPMDRVLYSDRDGQSVQLIGYVDDVLIQARFSGGEVGVTVAAVSEAAIQEAMEGLHDLLPLASVGTNATVPFTFWHNTTHGPTSSRRMLQVPAWEGIRHNYATETARRLSLMAEMREPIGGKLFVWHGPAGTGKTYSLRALAWEWRNWVDFHYLIDPETFFGNAPGSLMQVALMDEDLSTSNKGAATTRWKLLVLEDAGELLSMDAKEHVGQALSRLLNLVDGLIGQGLHLMVLITTNDELGKLHPAVTRHGRCALEIGYGPLSVEESNSWLARSDGHRVDNPSTLADLYALVNDWSAPIKRQAKVGFSVVR